LASSSTASVSVAVEVEVETPAGTYSLEADWFIDATGANSRIRAALGLEVNASRSTDRWCISDVRFETPLPAERWTWVDAPFNEGRAVWQHLMADDVWRLDYQIATAQLAPAARSVAIHKATRFSDHAPLTIDYDLTL